MKHTVYALFLLLMTHESFGQYVSFEPDQDSINFYFLELANEARAKDEYPPLMVFNGLKKYTEEAVDFFVQKHPAKPFESCWRLFRGDVDAYTEYMSNNWGEDVYWFENTGSYLILYRGENAKLQRIGKENEEYYKCYEQMVRSGPSNRLLARLIFSDWKYNTTYYSYTENIIHPLARRFYLAVSKTGDYLYADYIALNQPK